MTKIATHKSVRKDTQDFANTSQTMEAVNWDQSVLILMMTLKRKMKMRGYL